MATIPASENVFPEVLLAEVAAPAAAPSGQVRLYVKADGLLYWKDDAGTEYAVGQGDTAGHLADTTDAHDASAISFTPAGTIAATDVQAAIEEVASEAGGGGGTVPFKRTVAIGTGNVTTTSTSRVAIDTTDLAYLTLTLAIGDVVRCVLAITVRHSAGSSTGFDFEVDQPTSANTFIADAAAYGCGGPRVTVDRHAIVIEGLFTATEAGVHGFRPTWLTDAGTLTWCNASSGNDDAAATFSVENLGQPAA